MVKRAIQTCVNSMVVTVNSKVEEKRQILEPNTYTCVTLLDYLVLIQYSIYHI